MLSSGDINNAEEASSSNPQGTKHERKTLSTPTLALIAIVLVLAVSLVMFFTISSNKLEKDKNIVAGSVAGMTDEEIQKYLDDTTEASKVTTSIASTVTVNGSTKEAKWLIENPESNTKELKVTVTRDDNGEVIYQSGLIRPGYFVPTAPLSADLEKGLYKCTATFDVIDPSNNTIIGSTATAISVNVN